MQAEEWIALRPATTALTWSESQVTRHDLGTRSFRSWTLRGCWPSLNLQGSLQERIPSRKFLPRTATGGSNSSRLLACLMRGFSRFKAGYALGEGRVVGQLLKGEHDLFVTSLSAPLYLFESLLHVLKAVVHALLKRFDSRLQLAQLWCKEILNDCADIFDNAHRTLRILLSGWLRNDSRSDRHYERLHISCSQTCALPDFGRIKPLPGTASVRIRRGWLRSANVRSGPGEVKAVPCTSSR